MYAQQYSISVAYIASAPFLLVVHPSVPANSVGELIAYIKAKPGGLNYGSSGLGGGAHLAGEIFKTAAGVQLQHIAYKGGAPALVDLLGGQVPMVFDPIPTSITHVRGGRIKALAITSTKRSTYIRLPLNIARPPDNICRTRNRKFNPYEKYAVEFDRCNRSFGLPFWQ
jgi:tripartite-type tricarboxylate transporter receptor subunit TctC